MSRLNCVNDVEENQLDKIDETMINKDQLFKKMGGANTVMMGANKRAIQRKMSKLLCCSVSEDGDYLLVGTKSDEIQFWSLVDKILLGSIKLNSQVKEILLDNINGFIFVTSMNQVIRLKNPVKSKESDMYVMGPSLYSVLFVTYFKMFLEDEYDGDYPSHMNEWVILP